MGVHPEMAFFPMNCEVNGGRRVQGTGSRAQGTGRKAADVSGLKKRRVFP